ncbi:MAG: tetratricopeptide repeat protein, partial [Gemmatimonadota bacterium]
MKRSASGVGVVIALCLAPGLLAAQEEYRDPTCELDQGHFLVRAAKTYLQGATEEADPASREELLVSAHRNLMDAINSDQADNPAVWYFLGRYYYLQHDGPGADSAFSRVGEMVPECAADIGYYRESLWVRLVNRGIDSMQAYAYDGAKAEFRNANAVLLESNVALYYLAGLYGQEGDADSALHYFKRVVELGTADTAHLDNYHTSVENVATLYQMLGEWDSTVVWYEKVRETDPTNPDALFGIAEAHNELGNTDQAIAIYDEILSNAAAMNSLDLFSMGVSLFNAEEFEKAVEAFNVGLQKNPFYRDALFNLANTYLEISQDQGRPQAERDNALVEMDRVTHRLIEIDPKNRQTYRILAAAHSLQGMDDTTAMIMDQMDALTYEVAVDLSRPMSGGFTIAGRLINLEDTPTEVPTITFEFLDETGNVVSTDTIGG